MVPVMMPQPPPPQVIMVPQPRVSLPESEKRDNQPPQVIVVKVPESQPPPPVNCLFYV